MIYSLSNVNQNSIEQGISHISREIKRSFQEERIGSLLNGFLAFLCVILIFLSTNHSTPHSLQLKPQKAGLMDMNQPLNQPLKLAKKATQVNNITIVNKLANEASKNSPTNPAELKENIA